ncbi:MAG: fibronectin type III domain-containing protein [Calditrichota bacterium]
MNYTRLGLMILLALAAGLFFGCDREKDPPDPRFYPPATPGYLEPVAQTATTISLRWQDLSTDEQGFYVYMSEDSIDWAKRDSTAANVRQIVITGLTPQTTYYFYVTAFNQYGESDATNIRSVQTSNPDYPDPPTQFEVIPLSANIVQMTWQHSTQADSFVIERHTDAAAWQMIGSTPANLKEYTDSTVSEQTHYYYRVGTAYQTVVVWIEDSVDVTTPAFGVPMPPDSLQAEVVLGTGVVLTWIDRSPDEDSFEIGRAIGGLPLTVIASLPANTITYTDPVSEVNSYSYRLRSVNQYGTSAWTTAVLASYRFCSDGVVPICLGNYWDYNVDSAGTDYSIRRHVASVQYPTGTDFYLITEHNNSTGITDSLYFLRNRDDGCFLIPHPLSQTPTDDLLFRYPTGPSGSHYICHSDCVVVLNATPGISLLVSNVTYHNVISFQRFMDNGRKIQYFICPDSVGIIREVEPISSTPPVSLQRDLTQYYVQN